MSLKTIKRPEKLNISRRNEADKHFNGDEKQT